MTVCDSLVILPPGQPKIRWTERKLGAQTVHSWASWLLDILNLINKKGKHNYGRFTWKNKLFLPLYLNLKWKSWSTSFSHQKSDLPLIAVLQGSHFPGGFLCPTFKSSLRSFYKWQTEGITYLLNRGNNTHQGLLGSLDISSCEKLCPKGKIIDCSP